MENIIIWGTWDIFLLFIIGIIAFANNIKFYLYLKKNNPNILKGLVYRGQTLLPFLPDFMKFDPQKFISYLLKIDKNESKEIRIYKIITIISAISFIILLLYSLIKGML